MEMGEECSPNPTYIQHSHVIQVHTYLSDLYIWSLSPYNDRITATGAATMLQVTSCFDFLYLRKTKQLYHKIISSMIKHISNI